MEYEHEHEDDEGLGAFHAIASELIDAIHSRDTKAVAEALHAFYQECEMLEDHEEEQ